MISDKPSIDSIFLAAIQIQPEERSAYLDEVCAKDTELRAKVERLLSAQSKVASFLESPAPELGATHDQPIIEKPGTRIGPYIIREQIGEGGFGVVYVAEQEKPVRRKVALKIIKPGMDTKEIIARFEAERQALAMMDHPNIATVLESGATESGRPYFVMELVRGVPITEFCDEQKLSTRERLDLFIDVCRAVQHAHQKGIIHRDIKPSNVMVTMHDDRAVPKVIDFGVSKALHTKLTEETIYTAYGQMIGTPLYMSPEQAQMNALDVDTRSDVYSLGVLLYELLTGTTPFDKETLKKAGFDEMRRIIREEEPPRPSDRMSTLNMEALSTVSEKRRVDSRKLPRSYRGELDWIVMRALEKDRDRRYESASSLAADLGRYLKDQPVEACPPSVGYRLRKVVRRNKLRFAMAAVLLVAVGSITGSIGWMTRDRVERQARVSGQIELILGDVDRLIEQQKWPEALATARRAEALIAGGETNGETHQRVEQVLADLRMVERLDEIRLLHSDVNQTGFDNKGTDEAYAAAFHEYGIDVEKLSAAEAAKKCRAHGRVAVPLVVALDHWARGLHKIGESDNTNWRPLVAIAKLVDADPLRNRLRDLYLEETSYDITKELTKLAQAERLSGQPAATFSFLAVTLNRADLHKEAVSVLRQAQQTYPADFWVNFRLAYTINEQNPGDAEAIRFYSVALGLRPGNVAVLTHLGNVFNHQGKLDEAIAYHRRVIELDPKNASAHFNLGVAFKWQKKHDEAIACFRKAIEIEPKFALAHSGLGIVFWNQGKLDEAIACFRKNIEIDPKDHRPYRLLIYARREQKKYDLAHAVCNKLIVLKPDYMRAYYLRGKVFCDQKKYDLALADFSKGLDAGADAYVFMYGVALLRLNCHDPQFRDTAEALRLSSEAVKLRPKKAACWFALGQAQYRSGDFQAAIGALEQSLELNYHRKAQCRFVLAMAHWKLGHHEQAGDYYDEAIEWMQTNHPLGAAFSQSQFRVEAEEVLGIQEQ